MLTFQPMRPERIREETLVAWLFTHPQWKRGGGEAEKSASIAPSECLRATFTFADFATALAFGVQIGCHAEKRDHHPDMLIRWGACELIWSTHDAGGITELDLELASLSEAVAQPLTLRIPPVKG
jgi:4a-hydroxytetrahydrobiopterin dehydratase